MIARVGKPLVRLRPVGFDSPPGRLGFLAGTARVEADLKRDFAAESNAMFQLDGEPPSQGTSREFCWTPSSCSGLATTRNTGAAPWRLNVWIDGTTSLLQVDHVLAVRHLSWIHRDPLDRRLVVQASQEGLCLLTADRTLEGYGEMGRRGCGAS